MDHLPNGQLITTILALEKFKIEGRLIVHNCDTAFEIDLHEFNSYFNFDANIYAYFPVFEAKGDHWSFAKTELNTNKVIKIAEKKRISNHCSIGTYLFSSASQFLHDAKKYIEEINPDRNLGEYYIAPFLNYICLSGEKIEITSIKKTKLFGKFARTFGYF